MMPTFSPCARFLDFRIGSAPNLKNIEVEKGELPIRKYYLRVTTDNGLFMTIDLATGHYHTCVLGECTASMNQSTRRCNEDRQIISLTTKDML